MEIITKKELIASVAERWRYQYPKNACTEKMETIYQKLIRLPLGATENDVTNIIGNGSWTRNKCDECQKENEVIVRIGEEPDDDFSYAYICAACLQTALELAEK